MTDINNHIDHAADFVYLPGDNPIHATVEQYRVSTGTLAPLQLPFRVIAGDHEFELGDTAPLGDAFPDANRPEVEVVAGHTHYNELLDDGRGVYATYSTGKIEEGGDWPFVQIVAIADMRLVTRQADATQISHLGAVKILGHSESDIPRHAVLIAPGCEIHDLGARPEHGIAGKQFGPNRNRKHW